MLKTFNLTRGGLTSMVMLLALLVVSSFGILKAEAAINTELDFGSSGSEVTELQQFLATNSLIYPEGMVTGHFGPLTQAAVVQFQVAYDIPQVGRVGPMTQAKINNIMSSGLGLDTSFPVMANASIQTSPTSATINWTTNEPARGQTYYDTMNIRSDEATAHFQQPFISGVPVVNNTVGRYAQSMTLQGLQPNTTYSYVNRSIDNSGNISITSPNLFRTNP
ncbi:MAG: peptidoglycan-binding protein [Patescibacteria group bacterium]